LHRHLIFLGGAPSKVFILRDFSRLDIPATPPSKVFVRNYIRLGIPSKVFLGGAPSKVFGLHVEIYGGL
jgi:hypothetical protein